VRPQARPVSRFALPVLVVLAVSAVGCSSSNHPDVKPSIAPTPRASPTDSRHAGADATNVALKETPRDLGVNSLPPGVCYPDSHRVHLDRRGDGRVVSELMRRWLHENTNSRANSAATGLRAYAASIGFLSRTQVFASAVVCGIDHSNGYFFQVVVMRHTGHGWRLLAALSPRGPKGTWNANVNDVRIGSHQIVAQELTHRPEDAHCCPSLAVKVRWRYRHRQLIPTSHTAKLKPESVDNYL
jgi:hypothetical protein